MHLDNGLLEKLRCSLKPIKKQGVAIRINGTKKSQKSLKAWTKQKWRTKSGKPSTQGPNATGERYLPSSAIKS